MKLVLKAELAGDKGAANDCALAVPFASNASSLANGRTFWAYELLGKNKISKHSNDRLRLLWSFFTERFLLEIELDEHGARVRAILVVLIFVANDFVDLRD